MIRRALAFLRDVLHPPILSEEEKRAREREATWAAVVNHHIDHASRDLRRGN